MRANREKVKNYKIGLLCYNLCPATVDLLNRLSGCLEDLQLNVFPLVKNDISGLDIRFNYRPASFTGRCLVLNNRIPENQLLTIQLHILSDLSIRSDLIILLGIQSIPAIFSTLLARLMCKPILAISQTMPPIIERQRVWYIRFPKKLVLRLVHLHVVQTEATRKTLQKVYGINVRQMIYAPFDGGGNQFKKLLEEKAYPNRNTTRKELSTPKDAIVFTFVGTLIYLKGVDILLRAFAKVYSYVPKSYLWIVGADGKKQGQTKALKKQACELKIEDRVVFTGHKKPRELISIYRASDVFVLSTRKDVWPKVLVEAALVGLPLITTPVTGAAYTLVRDKANGFIVPVDNVNALTEAMLHLTNFGTRKEMGVCSQEIVKEYVQPELEVNRIKEAIFQLLTAKKY